MMGAYDQYKVDVPEGQSGKWRVERFTVRPHDLHESLRLIKTGRGVPAGVYTGLYHGRSIVMSDTPDEIRDHLHFIYRAHGRILVHGLGLGMVLKALLLKPEVTHVDVVEKSADVLALVGPSYSDPRVSIHHGDAYSFQFPPGTRWNYAWHDIWPDICTDNLNGMSKLHRRYGRRVDWQGSWCRERVLRHARAEKREYRWRW